MYVQVPRHPMYLVDEHGSVVSMKLGKWRVLKPSINRGGYLYINLCTNGVATSTRVHRLVAEAFIGPKIPGLVVNHINGDKLNNCITNLEYCTHSQNCLHAWANGLNEGVRSSSTGAMYHRAKLTPTQVTLLLMLRGKMTTRAAATQFGVSQTLVCQIWRGTNRIYSQEG